MEAFEKWYKETVEHPSFQDRLAREEAWNAALDSVKAAIENEGKTADASEQLTLRDVLERVETLRTNAS